MTELEDGVSDPEDEVILRKGDMSRIARMGSTVHHQEEALVTRVLADSRHPEMLARQDRAQVIAMTNEAVVTRDDLTTMHSCSPTGKRRVHACNDYGSTGIYRND